jgi:hypothetical protein
MKATRVTTFHDDYQGVKPRPPYPSAGLPRDTSPSIHGWPPYYPNVIREVQWGAIQLNDRRSYLVSGVPYRSYASIHNSMLVATGPNRRGP